MTYRAFGEATPAKYAFYRIKRDDVIAKCKEAPDAEKEDCIRGAVQWLCAKDSANPYKDDYGEDCEQGARISMENELEIYEPIREEDKKGLRTFFWGSVGIIAASVVFMTFTLKKDW